MRKIINSTFITIDGAVEDPHLWPSVGDSQGQSDRIQAELLESCDAMLLGRRTYESFAAVWPTRSDPFSDRFNAMRKIVVSTTLKKAEWGSGSVVVGKEVPAALRRMKDERGKNIVQYGIGRVTYTMLEHGLLDELHLWLYPLIRGRQGPHVPHFRDCPPSQFKLLDTNTLPNGITLLRYDVKKSA
jgi:dihydrofolate reductase